MPCGEGRQCRAALGKGSWELMSSANGRHFEEFYATVWRIIFKGKWESRENTSEANLLIQ